MSSSDKNEASIVSEVNTYLVQSCAKNVQPLVKRENKVVKLRFSLPKKKIEQLQQKCESLGLATKRFQDENSQMQVDEDGDLVVNRERDKDCTDTFVLIEFENATTLNLVGLQIWRGAFILGDFIISHAEQYFERKNVLELGAGTGLSSLVAAIFANQVVVTDLDEPRILNLINANKTHNKDLIINCEKFCVLPLDFMNSDWSSELKLLIAETHVFIVADVVYYTEITEAFVKTIEQIIFTFDGSSQKHFFITMEKRYVFTLSELDTVAPMYEDFIIALEKILGLTIGCRSVQIGKYEVSMNLITTDFPQHFNYERTKELVFFHLQCVPCK